MDRQRYWASLATVHLNDAAIHAPGEMIRLFFCGKACENALKAAARCGIAYGSALPQRTIHKPATLWSGIGRERAAWPDRAIGRLLTTLKYKPVNLHRDIK